MAERRMFAKSIVLSDAFLGLSPNAKNLYITMSMFADDDGFINGVKSIMNLCGVRETSLKLLIEKKFVIQVSEEIYVIKHWRINNYIRNDRYHATNYTEEKELLEIKENGAYRLKSDIGIPSNGIPSTVDRDKNSIDKNSIDKNIYVQEFEEVWKLYPRKQGKAQAMKKYLAVRKNGIAKETIEQGIHNYVWWIKEQSVKPQYIKQGSTWFNQECWSDDYSVPKQGRNDWIKDVEL